MDLELFNKITNLTPHFFYEPSKGMVTVHFFDQTGTKPDIVAYLKEDMSWDVREIVEEKCVLYDDYESVVVKHKPLSIEPKDSDFDKITRMIVVKAGKEAYGEDAVLEEQNKLFRILTNNSYKEN